MNGTPWTANEIAIIRRRYPNQDTRQLARDLGCSVGRVYAKATRLGLKKSVEYLREKRHAEAKRLREAGTPHRFKPGHVPANKGIKGWDAGGRSKETRFNKGHRPQTWVPVGTEVIDPDGYRKIKVSDDKAPSRFNWRYVHVLKWERRHGRVPPGHAVAFRDGDKTNLRLSNLVCIPRTELMRRNSIHRLPKKLVETIQLRGALVRQIKKRSG